MTRWTALALVLVAGVGRAEPSFPEWLGADPERPREVAAFEAYLAGRGVGGVLPMHELLRNATSWKHCRLDYPYSMPPRSLWPHVVPTLRFLRDEVVPRVGPLRVESGWREPKLNGCAGGAPLSAHAQFYALDLIPDRATTRQQLVTALCRLHRERGQAHDVGLGFYGGVRFHIDTRRFRRWGSDNHAGTSPCAKAGGRLVSRPG